MGMNLSGAVKKLLAQPVRVGEAYILFGTFLNAFFPIVTVVLYKLIPSSMVCLAWSMLFAALFCGGLVLLRGRGKELLHASVWYDTFMVTLCIGLGYYGFYYYGLTMTTAGNASLVSLFEVFTTFVFFNIWHREQISKYHIGGALMMLVGASIVLMPRASGFHYGDLFILAATACAPMGQYFQKRARALVSAETVTFLRSAMTAAVVFGMVYVSGVSTAMSNIPLAFGLLVISGVVFFSIQKMVFLEGIHRISVTKAIALQGLGPLVTILFAWLILHQHPTATQLISFVPLFIGVLLLTDQIVVKAEFPYILRKT